MASSSSVETKSRDELTAVCADLRRECAALRAQMASDLSTLLRWWFIFWISQIAANAAMMAFLLKAFGWR